MNRSIALEAHPAHPAHPLAAAHPLHHMVCFVSLFTAGRSLRFPCDEQGRVDLDTLSERARANYLFARAMVGRDYSVPSVERALG